MDPNEALRIIRENLVALDADENDVEALSLVTENFRALDTWLSRGGFKPTAWVI